MKLATLCKKTAAALLATLVAVAAAGCTRSAKPAAKTSGPLKHLVIAEPVHLIGYLPLYMAQREGYFKEQGLDIKIISATGGTHVTAVISGSAWGVIGGVDSSALGNVNNSDPVTGFVNVVNRANVYLFAVNGQVPASSSDADLKAFLKGKKIISGRYGGTPDLLTRYLLLHLGLDPQKDVQLIENNDASTVNAMMKSGVGQIGNGAEPQIIEGISQGISGEPFYKFPDMGDFSYSVMGTKKSTIEKDPATVQKFTNAIVKALKTVQNDKALTKKDLKLEFPTLSDQDIQASLDRAYADQLWSPDGYISEKAVQNDMDMLVQTGIYKSTYSYDTLVDMQFVNQVNK